MVFDHRTLRRVGIGLGILLGILILFLGIWGGDRANKPKLTQTEGRDGPGIAVRAMESVETILFIPLYLVPLLIVGGPIWFLGRRRVQWNRWDFALVLLPFAVWDVAMLINETGKSLSNLVELLYLGCTASLAPVVRVVVGRHANQKFLAIGLLVAVCLVAIGLWAFVPGLPE